MREGPPILVVDDNFETRRALTAVLNIQGYAVVEVADAVEALEYLRNSDGAVSLVVLDLHLPRMDGYQFLDVALADPDLRTIPIIVYSAVGPDRLPPSIPYVPKGSSPDRLLEAIARSTQDSVTGRGRTPVM
jgi:chemotaxis family two-component system sensor histidine kinase/response regulator PixL